MGFGYLWEITARRYVMKNRNRILRGIQRGDEKILREIYQDYYPMVQAYVTKNNGTEQDAGDLFHDSLIVVFQKSRQKDFNISCRFSTYLYAVCRNLWLKKLRNRKKMPLEENMPFPDNMEGIDHEGIYSEPEAQKRRIFSRCFARLSEACQKILTMSMEGSSVDQITTLMGHSTKQHTLNRKYRCKEALKKMVQNDPEYPELYT